MRRARQLCTQHRDEALPALQDRLQTLVEYRERLDVGSKERVTEVSDCLLKGLGEGG